MAPATAIPDLIQKQMRFWINLLESLPHIVIRNLHIQKKGDGVYAISLLVRNSGTFPTATAHGAATRLVRPILVKIFLQEGHVLEGNPVVFIPRLLGGGGSKKVQWLVTAPAGTSLKIQVLTPNSGSIEKTLVLQQ